MTSSYPMASASRSIQISSAVLVYLLIFFSPFSIYGVETAVGGLTPINVYCAALFPFFITICLLRNKFPNITALGILHLLYVFVAAISATLALDKHEAYRLPILYFAKFLLPFIYVLYFLRTRDHIERAAKILITMGIADALMGWVQLCGFFFFNKMIYAPFVELIRSNLTPKNFGHGFGALGVPGYVRMFGFQHEGGNFFGPYMGVPLVLSIYAAMKYKTTLLKFLVFFLGLTILISGSRSGFVVMGASLIFSFLFFRQGNDKQFYPLLMRSYSLLGIIGGLLLLAYISLKTNFFGLPTSQSISATTAISTPFMILARLNPLDSQFTSGSADYFSSHLAVALKHGFDNFGFGLGGANFDPFAVQLYFVKFGSHSSFIGFLGDTGYWGLLVQILIAFTTIRYGLAAYFNPVERGKRDHLILFLTAGFAGLVADGIIRMHYQDTLTFIVAGFITKLYLLNNGEAARLETASRESL